MTGIDEVGPIPNYAARNDLVDRGRVGPARAQDPALDGIRLWQAMDEGLASANHPPASARRDNQLSS